MKDIKELRKKQVIDNDTGVYQEVENQKVPMTNLYEGLDLNYMTWNLLFDFIGSLEYNLVEESEVNRYHMASEIVDIYLTISKEEKLTNIKVLQQEAVEKAENEYEKYKVIQDRNYVSDFDKLLLETDKIKSGDIDE